MLCLGGAFERLVVTGLTNKRLPVEVSEDPLLPDGMLDSLVARYGVPMLTSRVIAEFEDRRFAAVVGACTGSLWLASPEFEMVSGRRLLPSAHLLSVTSVMTGCRVGFAELGKHLVRVGTRARSFPDDPVDAIDTLELAVCRARRNPVAALADLAARAQSRRLLGFQRALDSDEPTPWTGRVSPGLLAVTGIHDDEHLPARQLPTLLHDPGKFFYRCVLGVWPLRRLRERWDPTERDTLRRSVENAIRETVQVGQPNLDRVIEAWERGLSEASLNNPHVSDVELVVARRLARDSVQAFLMKVGDFAVEVADLAGEPFGEVGWRVDASGVWLSSRNVISLRQKKPTKRDLAVVASDLVAAALLAVDSGVPAVDIRVYGPDGTSVARSVQDCASEVGLRLSLASVLLEGGWLPHSGMQGRGPRIASEVGDTPWDPDRVRSVLGEGAV